MCFDRNINGNRDVKFLIAIIGHCTDQRKLLYFQICFSCWLKKSKQTFNSKFVIQCSVQMTWTRHKSKMSKIIMKNFFTVLHKWGRANLKVAMSPMHWTMSRWAWLHTNHNSTFEVTEFLGGCWGLAHSKSPQVLFQLFSLHNNKFFF